MKVSEVNKKGSLRKILILDEEEKAYRRELKSNIEDVITEYPYVYSFAKGKSVKMALDEIRNKIDFYKYFIKVDIENYYGSIKVDKLKEVLEENLIQQDLIIKIEEVIKEESEVLECEGIALGSPLSNILGNIYLRNIDLEFGGNKNIEYIRFCDDICILSDEKDVLDKLEQELFNLGLTLNKEKTFIGSYGDKITFLGEEIIKEGSDELTRIEKNIENNKESFKNIVEEALILSKEEQENILENKVKPLGEGAVYAYRNIVFSESYEDIIEELIEDFKYQIIEELNNYKEQYEEEGNIENKLLEMFSVNSIGYYVSQINGKKEYEYIEKVMDLDIIRKHIRGDISLGVKLSREDDTSNIIVIDIDDMINNSLVEEALEKEEIIYYKEFSGKKGYHYWIFLDEYYTLKDINSFILDLKSKYFSNVTIEVIPRYNNIEDSETIIKLPLGVHPENNERSFFVGDSFLEYIYYNNLPRSENDYYEFLKDFKDAYPKAEELIKKCSVLNSIIKEGIITKRMSHYKRLLLLYNFKFLDEGDKIIHYIMSRFTNYSFNITEKNINKSLYYPISCEKIRSYVRDEKNKFKCQCNKSEISTPLEKVDKEKFKSIYIKSDVKKIVDKIMKLKEEKRALEKNITSLENKLEKIFLDNNTEEIELSIGKLKKKKEKWIIELEI